VAGRAVEGADTAEQEGHGKRVPDLNHLSRGKRADDKEQARLSDLRRKQQAPPIHTVGHGAPEERERDVRDRLHEAGEAQHRG
jgi:hypothetical protein